MRRREFIAGLTGAMAWPMAARAQQPAMPVIGFLNSESPIYYAPMAGAFRQGLNETGYIDGRNVAIEYRWADEHFDRLPALAADLVRRRVTAIAAAGALSSPLAAKAATSTIPIVFATGIDPVEFGLVASLNRPGGNMTGVTTLTNELGPKRLELLHGLVPAATRVGLLVNPTNPGTRDISADFQKAARTLGLEVHILYASTEQDLDAAFAMIVGLRLSGLVIGSDAFFNGRSEQLAALTLRHRVPTIYQYHQFALAGGLMSYGSNVVDAYRLVGNYTGRILKGEKPADLPVQQATKVELILNLKTAKALGIEFPTGLLVRADDRASLRQAA
jgi:putative tryptophan/tyrosine transport system substrate-binding protein